MQYSQLLTNRSDDHHRFNGQIDLEFMKQFELYNISPFRDLSSKHHFIKHLMIRSSYLQSMRVNCEISRNHFLKNK